MTRDKIIKDKWYLYGRWKQPVLSGTFWPYFRESEFAKELGALLGVEAPRDIFLDGYHLTHAGDNEVVKKYLVSAYEKGALAELHQKLETASVEAEKRHLAVLTTSFDSDFAYLEELFASYRNVVGSWSFLFRFSAPLEEKAVADGVAASDDEMLAHMKPYTRTTWLEQQSLEIADMAQMNPADPALEEKMESHVKEFAWFGTHHWEGEGYTIEKCLADIAAERIKTESTSTADKNFAPLPSGNETLWKLLALFAYWRTHCAEMSAKVIYASRERLERVAAGWGMTYAELLKLSHTEILDALQKSSTSINLPANYAERDTGWGVYLDEGKEYVITSNDLANLIDAVVPKVDTSVSEAKGVVASKGGILTGVARIMLGPADFSRFQEGDILVANETTPDFVPLMKKAKAIVTDTGGITSHAAIVSRELKKPCVIGTKIATKVFKDGDMIEVDAEKGIVRKI